MKIQPFVKDKGINPADNPIIYFKPNSNDLTVDSIYLFLLLCFLTSDICPLSFLLIRDAGLLKGQHLFKHSNGGVHNAHRQGRAGPLPQTHSQIKNGLKPQMS